MSLRADLPEYADDLEFAGQVLGPCQLVQDCSWEHGMSAVLRLRDARGVAWFAKRHRERDRYEAEVTAYRQWVPALGGRAAPAACGRRHSVRDYLVGGPRRAGAVARHGSVRTG